MIDETTRKINEFDRRDVDDTEDPATLRARIRALEHKLFIAEQHGDREERRSSSLARANMILREQLSALEQAPIDGFTANQARLASLDLPSVPRIVLAPDPVIKVKLLRPGAKPPVKARASDSGYDVFVAQETLIEPGKTAIVPLGVALQPPAGYCFDVHGRSGHESKGEFTIRIGICDSEYRGEIGAIVHVLEGSCTKQFTVGMKIGQIILRKCEHFEIVECKELDQTDRGAQGFGSSGNQ